MKSSSQTKTVLFNHISSNLLHKLSLKNLWKSKTDSTFTIAYSIPSSYSIIPPQILDNKLKKITCIS